MDEPNSFLQRIHFCNSQSLPFISDPIAHDVRFIDGFYSGGAKVPRGPACCCVHNGRSCNFYVFFFCLKMGPTYGELLKVMEKFKRENRWVSFQTHDILGGVSHWAKPQLRFQASQMGWNWAHFLRMAFKRLKTNMHICHVYLPSQVMKNYINDDQW